MKTNKKAKWMVGLSGAAFSAFVLGQLDHTEHTTDLAINAVEINDSMSVREKELVQLDWSDFSLSVNDGQRIDESDRTTRRT